jgi:hypothetical protein
MKRTLLAPLSKVTLWSMKHCKTMEMTINDIREESKNHPMEKIIILREERVIIPKSSMHVTSNTGDLWHEVSLTNV